VIAGCCLGRRAVLQVMLGGFVLSPPSFCFVAAVVNDGLNRWLPPSTSSRRFVVFVVCLILVWGIHPCYGL